MPSKSLLTTQSWVWKGNVLKIAHMVTSTVNCPKIVKKQGVFSQFCHLEGLPALMQLIFLKKKSLSKDLLKHASLRETEGGTRKIYGGYWVPKSNLGFYVITCFLRKTLHFRWFWHFRLRKKQGGFVHLYHLEGTPALIGLIFLKKNVPSTDLVICALLEPTEGGTRKILRGIVVHITHK